MRFSAGISTPNNLGINNLLALALFMARVLANDAHYVLALHNLASFTKSFY
jgi:hypothetical protein